MLAQARQLEDDIATAWEPTSDPFDEDLERRIEKEVEDDNADVIESLARRVAQLEQSMFNFRQGR